MNFISKLTSKLQKLIKKKKKGLSLLMILLLMVISFGMSATPSHANEVVVKPTSDTQWVMVRRDAYDYFMETINKLKFDKAILEEKLAISEEGRQKEYDQFILERQAKDALISTLMQDKDIRAKEMARLNTVIEKQTVQLNWLDTLLKISIVFNVYQAFD